jgi:hypothetical protein
MRTGQPYASAASRPARAGSPEDWTPRDRHRLRGLGEEQVGMGLQEAAGAELQDARCVRHE